MAKDKNKDSSILAIVGSLRIALLNGLGLLVGAQKAAAKADGYADNKEHVASCLEIAEKLTEEIERIKNSATEMLGFNATQIAWGRRALEIRVIELRKIAKGLVKLDMLEWADRCNDQAKQIEETFLPMFGGGQLTLGAAEGQPADGIADPEGEKTEAEEIDGGEADDSEVLDTPKRRRRRAGGK